MTIPEQIIDAFSFLCDEYGFTFVGEVEGTVPGVRYVRDELTVFVGIGRDQVVVEFSHPTVSHPIKLENLLHHFGNRTTWHPRTFSTSQAFMLALEPELQNIAQVLRNTCKTVLSGSFDRWDLFAHQ